MELQTLLVGLFVVVLLVAVVQSYQLVNLRAQADALVTGARLPVSAPSATSVSADSTGSVLPSQVGGC